jgi:hypothetical protein
MGIARAAESVGNAADGDLLFAPANHVMLGPTVCIVRMSPPLAGRTFESFS